MMHHLKRVLWMSFLRLVTPFALLSILLAAIVSPLKAQDPNTVIAGTPCQDNAVTTYVNIDYLGTDSTKEILVHEARHREQAKWSIKHLGHCPNYSDHLLLLTDEADAYCVSSVERVKRTHDEEENNYSTIQRLRNQFPDLTVDTIVSYWKRICPKFSSPKHVDRRELHGRYDDRVVSAPAEYCASDISCLSWRAYVRLGDIPSGDLYIAHSGDWACIIDGWTAGKMKIGDRLACDWRYPSARNQ